MRRVGDQAAEIGDLNMQRRIRAGADRGEGRRQAHMQVEHAAAFDRRAVDEIADARDVVDQVRKRDLGVGVECDRVYRLEADAHRSGQVSGAMRLDAHEAETRRRVQAAHVADREARRGLRVADEQAVQRVHAAELAAFELAVGGIIHRVGGVGAQNAEVVGGRVRAVEHLGRVAVAIEVVRVHLAALARGIGDAENCATGRVVRQLEPRAVVAVADVHVSAGLRLDRARHVAERRRAVQGNAIHVAIARGDDQVVGLAGRGADAELGSPRRSSAC